MVIKRGQVWWANLPEPLGSEPGYRRPVLVVQADNVSKSQVKTVICAVVTGNLARASIPGNVIAKAEESGLPRDSVVSVYQIVTLDKTFLDSCVSVLPDDVLLQVDQGIKLVLDLW